MTQQSPKSPVGEVTVLLTIDGNEVELFHDSFGYRGMVTIDGEQHLAHLDITRAGPRAVSPAKARIIRYVNGVEQ